MRQTFRQMRFQPGHLRGLVRRGRIGAGHLGHGGEPALAAPTSQDLVAATIAPDQRRPGRTLHAIQRPGAVALRRNGNGDDGRRVFVGAAFLQNLQRCSRQRIHIDLERGRLRQAIGRGMLAQSADAAIR